MSVFVSLKKKKKMSGVSEKKKIYMIVQHMKSLDLTDAMYPYKERNLRGACGTWKKNNNLPSI